MAKGAGDHPVLDHDRIVRAIDKRIRGDVPATTAPIQSANQTLEKVSLTLNRAGTHKGNPILAGLALRVQIPLGTGDTLLGLFVFTDRADPKGNLLAQVSGGPAGLRTFDLPIVEGLVTVGSPSTGARRNYIRQVSRSGKFERTFYVQSKDFNTVQLNGLPALSPVDLSPVPITVKRPNTVDPFIDVVADFFVAWADEFHVEHRSENANLDPGFAKAYGGALFVSVFDTNPTPGVEGVGVEVSPFTELNIDQQKKVQVQNTVGLKRGTFRFRAKQGSPFFVDCPFEVNVIEDAPPPCDPPVESDNGGPEVYVNPAYIPPQTPPHTPIDIPGSDLGGGDIVPYSVPGITPATFTGSLLEPILVFTIQAQAIGGSPTILIRRWTLAGNSDSIWSVDLSFVDEKEYIPLVVSGATLPSRGAPYLSAQALRVGLSKSAEVVDGIVLYEFFVKEESLVSKPATMLGPALDVAVPLIAPGTGISDPPAPI